MSAINTNINAMIGASNLNHAQEMLGRSLSRLSSGSKVVNPSDDPAGMGVSEKLGAQSSRVQAAATNVQNAISFLQTTDSFMNGMSKVLQRMSELGTLAKDPTKGPSDVALYQEEFTALQDQLRSTVGGSTSEVGGTADIAAPLGSFEGNELFKANPTGTTVTIGADASQTMTIGETNLRQGAMLAIIQQDNTGAYTLDLSDPTIVTKLSSAIQQVANGRASLGATQSRLELASDTLQVQGQNLEAAISTIKDVDVADESTQYAKYNILVQSSTAMLVQANQAPQAVLRLLQAS